MRKEKTARGTLIDSERGFSLRQDILIDIQPKSTAIPAHRFKIRMDPLSDETLEIARNELRETDEIVKKSLEELRILLKSEPTLFYRDDEDALKIFLRPCKFYPKSALELMKRIADFKMKYYNVIGSIMPVQEEDAILNNKVVNVLVDPDQHGRMIFVANLGGAWDTKKVTGDQIFRLFYIIQVVAMHEPETQVRGFISILDFEHLSLKQIAQLTPSFSLRLLTYMQDALALRVKQVHIVKQPVLFSMVWKIFQPLIRSKLRKRLFFHGWDMSSLHKHISPEHLPEDYGGKLPKIDYSAKEWYPEIRKFDTSIEEWNSWGRKK